MSTTSNPERPRMSRATLMVLCSMNLVDCIAMNLLNPYAEEMVSTLLNKPKEDPEVLRNVAFLIGIYNLAEMIISPMWGVLSDHVGRRPALLLGYAGTCIMPLFFGMATSLPAALISRALIGIFSGNVNVTKTCLAELVDKSNEARYFGMLSFCYGLGMVIGPILGGFLVHPDRLSSIFVNTIFEEYPYLLPNLVYSSLSALAWLVGACCLPETLPKDRRRSLCQSNVKAEKGCKSYPSKLLRMMLAYGMVVACIIFTTQTILEVLQLERDVNGFDASPKDVGLLQNFAAAGLLIMQLCFYPYLTKTIGYRACIIFGYTAVFCVVLPFPLYGLLADPKFGLCRFLPVAFMMFVQQAAYGMCLPTTSIWLNRYADGLDRGKINGLANSFAALLRAFSPSAVSLTLELGLSTHTYLGRYMPILLLVVMAVITICLAAPVLPKSEVLKTEGDLEKAEPEP